MLVRPNDNLLQHASRKRAMLRRRRQRRHDQLKQDLYLRGPVRGVLAQRAAQPALFAPELALALAPAAEPLAPAAEPVTAAAEAVAASSEAVAAAAEP